MLTDSLILLAHILVLGLKRWSIYAMGKEAGFICRLVQSGGLLSSSARSSYSQILLGFSLSILISGSGEGLSIHSELG